MFLRRMARPLMAKVKETTGIVGLDVVPAAREVLISLYSKTLKEIIEKRLECGQVEEIIEEAKDELTLIGKMIVGLH